jgi:hypothetical protein
MKFRKKPVEIEAVQYTGENLNEILQFVGRLKTGPGCRIETLEGTMEASPGDWIIKGVKGEFYPCKPEIFLATYEPVEDE